MVHEQVALKELPDRLAELLQLERFTRLEQASVVHLVQAVPLLGQSLVLSLIPEQIPKQAMHLSVVPTIRISTSAVVLSLASTLNSHLPK